MGSGDADEPGGAEEDEGHECVYDGCVDVRRYPTVYRGPRVWQALNVGVWIGLVPELEGWRTSSSSFPGAGSIAPSLQLRLTLSGCRSTMRSPTASHVPGKCADGSFIR
jgi:hypothetical protein